MNEKDVNKILNNSKVGLWQIIIKENQKSKMFCNSVMLELLGFKSDANPEKVYEMWVQNIGKEYIDYIFKAIEKAKVGDIVEVEYPYYHNNLGIRYVRCGGSIDNEYTEGLKIIGYHYDITEKMKMKFHKDDKHVIVDPYKFYLYSLYFIDLYDDLFEIELSTMNVKNIFYSSSTDIFLKPTEHNIIDIIKNRVHKDDIDRVVEIFDKENIERIIKTKEIIRIDFRVSNYTNKCNKKYRWIRAVLFPIEIINKMNMLCYTYGIEDFKQVEILTKEKEEIMSILVDENTTILDLNLETQDVKIFNTEFKNNKNIVTNHGQGIYSDFLEKFVENYLYQEDKLEAIDFLNIENVKQVALSKENKYIDIQLNNSIVPYKWVKLTISPIKNIDDRIFIFIKSNNNKQNLLQGVMEKFIIKNFDFLYYVDLKNKKYMTLYQNSNSYNMLKDYFDTEDEYKKELNNFILKYVVEEDRDYFRYKTTENYILKELEKFGILSFSIGIKNIKGNYQRKRIDVQYYSKQDLKILVQVTDITDIYTINKIKNDELEKVKKEMSIDYLTKIYNRLGLEKEIKKYLRNFQNDTSAFILIDLDNFKNINDIFGHDKGDEVLIDIANILKQSFRSTDIVARLGGDEFVVFLKDIKDKNIMQESIKRLIKKLDKVYKDKNNEVEVSASAGIVYAPEFGDNFNDLYKKADKALYYIKNHYKNGFYIYNDDLENNNGI